MSDAHRPDWPAEMLAQTLANYLDVGSTATLYRKIKEEWDDFPPKSPVTKRWYRRDVDDWLAAQHRFGRGISAQRARLESELGLGKS